MWDKIICWFVVLIIACSCGNYRQVISQGVTTKDTVYVANHSVDSVYVDRYVCERVKNDTVWITDIQYKYKYKVKTDTVYKARVDSVVVVREVPVVQERPYVPKVMWWLAGFGVVSILLMVLWVLRKFNIV